MTVSNINTTGILSHIISHFSYFWKYERHGNNWYNSFIETCNNRSNHIVVACWKEYVEYSKSNIGSCGTKRISETLPINTDWCYGTWDQADIIMRNSEFSFCFFSYSKKGFCLNFFDNGINLVHCYLRCLISSDILSCNNIRKGCMGRKRKNYILWSIVKIFWCLNNRAFNRQSNRPHICNWTINYIFLILSYAWVGKCLELSSRNIIYSCSNTIRSYIDSNKSIIIMNMCEVKCHKILRKTWELFHPINTYRKYEWHSTKLLEKINAET